MTLEERLLSFVSPDTHQPLELRAEQEQSLFCPATGQQYPLREGIPVFIQWGDDITAAEFEQKYQSEREPWSYKNRAAELLRHEYVAQALQSALPSARKVLDLGCSLGQLSQKLGELFPNIVSLDVSLTAVLQARNILAHSPANYTFVVASAAELPFANHSFDCVVASDGLHGWELPRELQQKVILEIERVLEPGGVVLFTDYLHPRKFQELIRLIDESPLHIVRVDYLNDRLWYQIESWFHKIQGATLVRALLKNMTLARFLRRVSALRGQNGSKHIGILAQTSR